VTVARNVERTELEACSAAVALLQIWDEEAAA
jgi:hypothetical protein